MVKPDGLVELPELGDIRLEGLTIEEAEVLLEEAYASFYKDPFVILRVQNNRVYIFPGETGKASVVTLRNMNTTLLEVLALSGGIGNRANASKVKLIRRTEQGNEVYKMDYPRLKDWMQRTQWCRLMTSFMWSLCLSWCGKPRKA